MKLLNKVLKRSTEDGHFKIASDLARRYSTCLKINIGAVIVKNKRIVGRGYNLCSPDGFNHGQKFKECKRINLPSGQSYDLCKSIHAEIIALIDAGAKNCRGATLYLSGHYYPCWNCESHARQSGIKEIKVRDLFAKEFYKKQLKKTKE